MMTNHKLARKGANGRALAVSAAIVLALLAAVSARAGDISPPTISCPANLTVKTPSFAGTAVSFTVTASDDAGPPTVVCTPTSGSVFSPGSTLVRCVATDAAGNSNSCSFLVEVVLTTSASATVNAAIPDADFSGVISTLSLNSPLADLSEVSVVLNIAGGYNGDLFAYLIHDAGFAVLLNRPGRSATDANGYPDSGFNVTLSDQAANGDIHVYRATVNPHFGALTGIWAPDGRDVDPDLVTPGDPRTATLSVFNGGSAAGEWTLFLADLAEGDAATLVSWGLTVCGQTRSPIITNQPASRLVECMGSTVLQVGAKGSPPMAYQWFSNNTAVAHATNATLALGPLRLGDSANFLVVITNSYGGMTSAVAAVTVVDTVAPAVALNGLATMTIVWPGTFADPGATANDACAGSLPVTVTGVVNTNVIGDYLLTYSATDGANTGRATRLVTVVDRGAPRVTLNGSATMITECHAPFLDPGATALDDYQGSVLVMVSGTVNVNSPGSYLLSYVATDASGNVPEILRRTVVVVDTAPPVVTLIGAALVEIECGATFTDPGAVALDACAGPVPVSVFTNYNPNASGTYTFNYYAADFAANFSPPVQRTLVVRDSTPPALLYRGATQMLWECHAPWTDPGVLATDTCAGDLPVIVSGNFDPNAPGTYLLTYTATDSAGNSATTNRTVRVQDTQPPTLEVSDLIVRTSNPVGAAVAFTIRATDACDGSVPVTCVPPSGSFFAVGNTPVVCVAQDSTGHSVTNTFTVTVIAVNEAPTAALTTNNVVVLEDSGPHTNLTFAVFTVGPADEVAVPQSITNVTTLSVTSSTLFSVQPTLGTNGALTFTPATNANGTSLVTFSFQDNGGTNNAGVNTTTNTFLITVTSVNDAPTLAAIVNPAAILEDAGQQTVALSGISTGGGESQTLTVTATSSNPGLIPNPTVTYTSPNATGSLTYSPVGNASGTAVISVVVTDDGGTADGGVNAVTNTFTVTVNSSLVASNATYVRAPGLSLRIRIADIARDLNGLPIRVLAVSAGAQGATFNVNSTDIFYIPVNNNNDSFTYTVSNGSGTSSGTITITVAASGGTANTITVSGGTATIKFFGIPGFRYDVQRTTSLTEPVTWTTLTTGSPLSPGADGSFSYTDTGAPNGSAYYRSLLH